MTLPGCKQESNVSWAYFEELDQVTRAGSQGAEVDDTPATLHQQHLVETLQQASSRRLDTNKFRQADSRNSVSSSNMAHRLAVHKVFTSKMSMDG
jgi:hypothetical protein